MKKTAIKRTVSLLIGLFLLLQCFAPSAAAFAYRKDPSPAARTVRERRSGALLPGRETSGLFLILGQLLTKTLEASDGSSYTVRVSYGPDAQIPEDTELQVTEISEGGRVYEEYLKKTMNTVGESRMALSYVRFFDISLMLNGAEIEPQAPVNVEIELLDKESGEAVENATLIHFTEDPGSKGGTAQETAEILELGETETPGVIRFSTDGFSVFGVVYTVDFEWEVDGRTFSFSLPGGGFAALGQLAELLGIAQQADGSVRAFLEDVESVSFSAPDLVWIGKAEESTTVGALKEANGLTVQYSADLTEEEIAEINGSTVESGDWVLISLQPFSTEESLTVTMKNGEEFIIRVKDAQYESTVIPAAQLDGQSGVLVRTRDNLVNAVQDVALNNTHLQAIDVAINSNTGTLTTAGDAVPTRWTFEKVPGTTDHYYISSPYGYMNIGAGSASVSGTRQELQVQTSGNEIRIKRTQDNYALNNDRNLTANGYSSYNGSGNGYMNPGEWFTVYRIPAPQVGDSLDGLSLAIINNRDGGWHALRDEIDGTKDWRGYYMSGNNTTYTRTDGVDYSSFSDVFWTFEYVSSDDDGSYYRIKTANGYLSIDPHVTRKEDMPSNQSHAYEHALTLAGAPGDGSADDGTLIRIIPNTDGTYLLQNRNGVCLWNYGNNQFWLSTLGEETQQPTYGRFRLTRRPQVPHVTVHYVDRNGNPLTNIPYTGTNPDVFLNADGTFEIPYNTSGNIDLRTDFNFSEVIRGNEAPAQYTYANTHLAGDGNYSNLTYEGSVIDSALIAANGGLQYRSDSGETYGNDMGNRGYGSLNTYSLAATANKRPAGATGQVAYAQETNKDIYVILDPIPGPNAAPSGSGSEMDAAAPDLSKTMAPNDDGTYTLSLKVDAHGRNLSDTNKANILFVVDTSSSMRSLTTNGHNRIEDTHDAILELGQKILNYNKAGREDAVEVAMVTFDGNVVDRLPWTKDKNTFTNTVNTYLYYPWLHTGTDWEDAMKRALEICLTGRDADPTFVVFFTDGEPSQYTNFRGAGRNGNPDPTGHYSGQVDDPGTSYPNFYSYFLCRESSKDEMRAIVNTGVQLYGIYAYNTTNESYAGYNGNEDGALMLHNAIKYGYNTSASLEDNLFFEARNTSDLKGAFDKIYNSITEKVGFSNVVVEDGISAGVTSSTVIEGDVSAFTYIIRDNTGAAAYKVTVAPNGVPEGQTAADGTPIFTIGNGTPVIGEIKSVPVTRILKDNSGAPILDSNGKFQTETVNVEVYYYKDTAADKEYIMPISTTGEHVSWDLSPLGLLKDGWSYEVSFVVWPNQEAYDLVADLNNGNRPDIIATGNWENCPLLTDSHGRQYRQGGFPGYPYISRYEDTGVYSAMSNTEQKIDYYKFHTKIEDGEEVVVITHGSKDVLPPDPMPLTSSYSRLEKLWNVERDPGIFAQYLYNTDGSSKGFTVDFDIFRGTDLANPYVTTSIGWVYDKDENGNQIYLAEGESGDYVLQEVEGVQKRAKGHYAWAPGDTMTNVTYAGFAHQIGTRWATDFAIGTGLMLTAGQMETLGLNKSLYPSAVFEGTTYYILEPGHDYTIKEHQTGTIGYEFDFSAPVYHPMLIDGVLKNVEITYTYKINDSGEFILDENGKPIIETAQITGITGSEAGLSGLEIQNTLRGYINLNKIVVDKNGQPIEDDTKFVYTVRLESTTDPGPFKGDHIPWFGVNGLFYNDGAEHYYQIYEAQNGVWMIRDEAGREYEVTSTGFDPDKAEAQAVTYLVNGQPKNLTIYGNQMQATEDGKTATATIAITQTETLYIANVPVGTTYNIMEADIDEYVLIDILKQVKHGSDVEQEEHVTTGEGNRTAAGVIVSNRDNHVTYTNQVRTGNLEITKTIRKNGILDPSATGTFYYAVYDEEYDPNADPPQTPVRTGSIEVTEGGTASVTENDLKIGQYYVYELTGEGGTPVTSGGIWNGGRFFTVTTSGSPATVELDKTAHAGIVNNYETIPVTAEKSWADGNPDHITVYFKLFYRTASGVDFAAGTPLKELPYGTTSVTWEDLPKYDENGQEYTYIVREYVLDEEHGEYEEGGHRYTEAAPSGYVNTEAGLTVTNSKLETYDPVTTYSGIKLWVDTVNGSKTRPDGLNVTLMIDKEPYNDPAGDVPAVDMDGNPPQLAWVTIDEDEWRYTFHNLPMFDENKQIIRYYAVETPVNGYEGSVPEGGQINTKYEYRRHTLDHTDNDAYPVMSSDADLVYCAVRIQHEGHLHHIWTQRIPTDEEKSRLVSLVNQDLTARNLPADATVENVRWVSGLPINHEFVWKAQPNGYKVSFTRYNTNTIHIKVDNHGAFSNICYGTLQYDYTAGSTNFTNELKTVTHTVEKTWGDGATPPEGSVITAELQASVTRPVNPQPEGAAETVYETVSVDLAAIGITQKIRVTLNGGLEGGDDTAQDPWKYTWPDLPQYDKDGNEITYSVKELTYTIGDHTVSLTEFPPTTTPTPGRTVLTNQIPSYSFELLKIDADTAKPLKGAKFTIQPIRPTSSTETPVPLGDPLTGTPEVTGENGRIAFSNIPLGYYEVAETQLPAGYILTGDGLFYIRVDTDGIKLLEKVITDGKLSFREVTPGAGGRIILGNVEMTRSGNTFTFTVENTPGTPLPQSGGPGTALYTALGLMLLTGAGTGLMRKKRRRDV